jgi:site-specific recombinase XerD
MPRKRKIERHKGVYEKHPGSGIWWIRYTKDGTRLTESIGSHSDAVEIIQQRMVEIRKGVRLSNSGGRRGTKFSVLVTDAISYSNRHHKDKRNFKQRLELANEEFGGRAADSITPQEIGNWLEDMGDAREWEAATRNRVKAAISKAYKLGMMNSKVHTNPARLVSSKKENPGRLRFVSDDEEIRLRKVIAAQRPHCMYQYDVAVHTGMRKGEQFTVTWDQVDFDRGFIYLEMTKNGSDRYVHLNKSARAALTGLKKEHERLGLKFETLFFDHRHQPIKDPSEWFEVACDEANVEGVTWHILRHTFASRLVMAGVHLRTVQDLMGHKTAAMTARYAHLAPAHLKTALGTLDLGHNDRIALSVLDAPKKKKTRSAA